MLGELALRDHVQGCFRERIKEIYLCVNNRYQNLLDELLMQIFVAVEILKFESSIFNQEFY